MNKAIFLDRDGTINVDVNYLSRPDQLEIIPETAQALQSFKRLGFLNIIITNQSGIARGYLTEQELAVIHDELLKKLSGEANHGKDDKALIDDIFFSPYHAEGIVEKYKIASDDRKPGTGMIRKAALKHEIDLTKSFFIGDSFTDMQCAEAAGLKKILVSTGYGIKDHKKCLDENIVLDYFAKDLYDASLYITNLHNNK